jgi:hypothetical protein
MTGGPLGGPLANPNSVDGWIAFLREYFAGDYNRDQVVDATDHGIWRATFGSTTELAADGNRNGIVDAADYIIWRNNFASGNAAAGGNAELVPEPASIVLLSTILALGAICARRSRVSDVA